MTKVRKSDHHVAAAGWPVLALAGGVTIALTWIYLPLGCFALGIMMWLTQSLRVPHRMVPSGANLIVAPADGVVIDVAADPFPQHQIGAVPVPAQRITIMTRLTDMQSQLSPITGHVVDNVLMPGLFTKWGDTPASWQVARQSNERREIRLRHASGCEVVLAQLGSQTARQLICPVPEGKFLEAGEVFGMARLAGVCDLFIPAECQLAVTIGQHMVAGETVIAALTGPHSPAVARQASDV
jgi:phosphatidylserine decarboxylase